MKAAIFLAALAVGGLACAQSSQQACNSVADLGRSLAADRDRGVSLQEQLRRNAAAVDGARGDASMKDLLDSIARNVHGEMKKVTPEDTYWRLRTLCLSAPK